MMCKTPEKFFESYEKAVLNKDIELMLSLYSEDISLFDMWNKYSLNSKNELITMITAWFSGLKNETVRVNFSGLNIQSNLDFCIAHGFIHFAAFDADNKELRKMKNRFTVFMVKQDNFWKVKHQHTSIPVSDKDITGVFE